MTIAANEISNLIEAINNTSSNDQLQFVSNIITNAMTNGALTSEDAARLIAALDAQFKKLNNMK